MQRRKFHRFAAALVIAASIGLSACGGSSVADAAGRGAPSGNYESRMPDGTTIQLRFRDGGNVVIAMTDGGETNSHDGKWVLNGEVVLVEGGEGMLLQLSWRGDALVTDFGGATLTFNRT